MARAELDLWMARLADGDRAAFRTVFDLLWGPTLRLCQTLLKNDADAADAAQQAMTKILERASDYDPARPAMPWALALAGWECKTIQRRRTRRRESAEQEAGEPASPSFEEQLANAELADAALQALGGLSSLDRETLRATFWDEATMAGGATLRKRRERALGRLREIMRRLYG